MQRCQKCGRVWRTLPGEETDHACPNCGPVMDRPHRYRPFTTRDGWQACAVCYGRKDDPIHDVERRVSLNGET